MEILFHTSATTATATQAATDVHIAITFLVPNFFRFFKSKFLILFNVSLSTV